MFYHLLFIHLFRPFLKYTKTNSPLPSHVLPRKICTQSAATISKFMRLYKRTHGLRQICNIAVYIAHSACTIHLLNLPNKDAKRDIAHGVRQLEEIAEMWLCARRTLVTLSTQARQWNVDLPEETATVLARTDAKYRTHVPQSPSGKGSPTIEQVQRIVSQQAPNPLSLRGPSGSHNATYPTPSGTPGLGQYSGRAKATEIPPSANIPPPNTLDQGSQDMADMLAQQMPVPNGAHNRPAASAIFGGFDTLFEDSKDWWLKDQSSIFDNWPRRESGAGSATTMTQMTPTTSSMGNLSSSGEVVYTGPPIRREGNLNENGADEDGNFLNFGTETYGYDESIMY